MTGFKVLGAFLDTKLSFNSRLRLKAASASKKLGIMRKALCFYGDLVLVSSSFFWRFMLPLVEYCSPAWMSVAAYHPHFIDRVVSKAVGLSDGLVVCDLEHRLCVSALCMLYKIRCNSNYTI